MYIHMHIYKICPFLSTYITGVGKSRFTVIIQRNNTIINKQCKSKLLHILTTVNLLLPMPAFLCRYRRIPECVTENIPHDIKIAQNNSEQFL